MKKENIFDLYAAQHKDEPEPTSDRVPGEVKPEDVASAQEVAAPEPKQEAPEPSQEPAQETQEGGNENGA